MNKKIIYQFSIISFILVLTVTLLVLYSFRNNNIKLAVNNAENISNIVRSGLTSHMINGNMHQVDTFINTISNIQNINQLWLVRSDLVNEQFGKIENSGDEFYSTPLYLSVKRNFFKGPIYIKGLGGIVYNHNSNGIKEFFLAHISLTGITETEINNGYYYGGGIGLDWGNLELEALYCVNELEAKFVNSTGTYYSKIDNNRISLGISYAFEVGK